MGKGGGTTVSKTEPPDEIKPYLKVLGKETDRAYNDLRNLTGDFTQFPTGRVLAGTTDVEREGIDKLFTTAQKNMKIGSQSALATNAIADALLGGKYNDILTTGWSYGDEPGKLQGAIDASLSPVQRRLTEDILPTISSAAIEGGAYGGGRFQQAQTQALHDFSTEAGNIAAQLGYKDYADRRELDFRDFQNRRALAPQFGQLELAQAGLIPTLEAASFNNQLLPAQALGQAAAGLNTIDQREIDNKQLEFERATQQPFTGLDTYSALIHGLAGSSGSIASQRAAGGGLGSALQGGLGGASLGAAVAPSISSALGVGLPWLAGPWGAGIGAGIGILGSIL